MAEFVTYDETHGWKEHLELPYFNTEWSSRGEWLGGQPAEITGTIKVLNAILESANIETTALCFKYLD